MATGPQLLARFDALVNEAVAGHFHHFSARSESPRSVTLTPKDATLRKLLVLGAIHGDEIGGLSAIVTWLERARGESSTQLAPGCEVTFAIGNPEAVAAGRRFVDRDLNRSFGRTLEARTSSEDRRAPEIERLIFQSDLVLDLHQTIQPADSAFFVIRANTPTFALLANWSIDLPILAYPGDFSEDGSTAGSFAAVQGKASLTLETGQLGEFDDQRAMAFELFNRIVASPSWTADQLSRPQLLQQLEGKRLFTWGQTVKREGELALIPGLRNLSIVKEGELLAQAPGREVRAEATAPVLFPKYGEMARVSAELVRCLRPLSVAELAGWLK